MNQETLDLGDVPEEVTFSVGELAVAVGDALRQAFPDQVWVRGEYLLWWLRGASTPVLVTTGPADATLPGAIGSPGTVVLFGGAFFSKVKIDGRWRSVCDPGWTDAFSKRFAARLAEIAPASGKRFVVLPPPPVGKWESPSLADDVACFVRAVRAGAGDVPLIDLPSKLCPSGRCQMESKGAPVRPDGLHFDGLGAEDIARWALEQVL